ncbi:MAG: tRNA-specific adenosine deaminase [Bacteroidales bacterium]|nr:MAG: tRNA-specific adenosine deaminase [Bacteroidales bacterium]
MSDEYYMNQALKEAQYAFDKGEIPVGAVVVCNDTIISRSHNLTEQLNDVTAHAEILAITSAANALGGKYLRDCTLYVTLEPCVMCAGALAWSQIGRIVFGASDSKRGFEQISQSIIHPKTIVQKGLLEDRCRDLLLRFFDNKR